VAVGEPAAGSPPKKISVVHCAFALFWRSKEKKPTGNVKAQKLANKSHFKNNQQQIVTSGDPQLLWFLQDFADFPDFSRIERNFQAVTGDFGVDVTFADKLL
jgi:hypothetical protein